MNILDKKVFLLFFDNISAFYIYIKLKNKILFIKNIYMV